MAALTNYLRNALLDHTLRSDDYTAPAQLYLGVLLTPGAVDGSGTEPTGGGYARVAIDLDVASAGSASVSDAESWAPLHTSSDLIIVGFGIFDAAADGNLLAFGAVGARLVVAGRTLALPDAALILSARGEGITDYLANKWLDHLSGAASYTPPTALHAGFYTDAPTRSTTGTEVDDAAYERKAVTFAAAAAGVSANNSDLEWEPLAADDPQTLAGWALSDDDIAGNQLFFGEVEQDVEATDIVSVVTGALTCRAA